MFSKNVYLQNISDKNENSLDDHPIVLASFVELLPQQLAQVLGQHGPQLLVDERSLVQLRVQNKNIIILRHKSQKERLQEDY